MLFPPQNKQALPNELHDQSCIDTGNHIICFNSDIIYREMYLDIKLRRKVKLQQMIYSLHLETYLWFQSKQCKLYFDKINKTWAPVQFFYSTPFSLRPT